MRLEAIINEFFWELEKQYPSDHPMIRKFGFIDTYKTKIENKLLEIESNINDIIAEADETQDSIDYWRLELEEEGVKVNSLLMSLSNIKDLCEEIR
jgi:hypothetical protein